MASPVKGSPVTPIPVDRTDYHVSSRLRAHEESAREYTIATDELVSDCDLTALIAKVEAIVQSKLPDLEIREQILVAFREVPKGGLFNSISNWIKPGLPPTEVILPKLLAIRERVLKAW